MLGLITLCPPAVITRLLEDSAAMHSAVLHQVTRLPGAFNTDSHALHCKIFL